MGRAPHAWPGGRFRPFPRHRHEASLGEPLDLSKYHDAEITTDLLRQVTDEIMAAITTEVEQLRAAESGAKFAGLTPAGQPPWPDARACATHRHPGIVVPRGDGRFRRRGPGRPGRRLRARPATANFGPRWHTDDGLAEFLAELDTQGDPSVPPPPGWVHSSTYWWADGAEFLGAIRIRHRLTPGLLEHGGHIGYDVAPKARRRGHGTAMLRAALPVAAGLGIDKALLTCDVDNVGSRKVIEANDGVLEDERAGMLRFWVPTGID